MAEQVSISVTHQFGINNEKAWVKVEYTTDINQGESFDQAVDRANTAIQNKIIQVIENTAKTVIDYENGQNNAVRN